MAEASPHKLAFPWDPQLPSLANLVALSGWPVKLVWPWLQPCCRLGFGDSWKCTGSAFPSCTRLVQ